MLRDGFRFITSKERAEHDVDSRNDGAGHGTDSSEFLQIEKSVGKTHDAGKHVREVGCDHVGVGHHAGRWCYRLCRCGYSEYGKCGHHDCNLSLQEAKDRMQLTIAMTLAALGIVYWLWGTLWLLSRKSSAWKLHALGVADTLGSVLIILGFMVRYPHLWVSLLLALISVVFWGTLLSFILARGVVSLSHQ